MSSKKDLLKTQDSCPKLFVAPMEGVGSFCFRKALSKIGGFDEACTEFIRIPHNYFSLSLVKSYNSSALSPYPQAAQLMGSTPDLMAQASVALEKKQAPRIDLNCGCPSNTVTGRGAGSSLLKDPDLLYTVAKAMTSSVSTPVSVKLRSGFEDTTLFDENMLAAQEAGACFVTLHPRTKKEGYTPPANWSLIARAKDLLDIPVIGNGDIQSKEDAVEMLSQTKCDALMIGRGCVVNPWIFHEIKSHFSSEHQKEHFSLMEEFLKTFCEHQDAKAKIKNQINHFKQLINFLFRRTPFLQTKRMELLRSNPSNLLEFRESALSYIKEDFVHRQKTGKNNQFVE